MKSSFNNCMGNEYLFAFFSVAGGCQDFDLMASYPPRKLGNEMTMEQAGLIPNGTVHARKALL